MKIRTLVIGDIHGGFRAINQILSRAKVTSSDVLIFLGDYVDGWSESLQVIDFLIELSKHQQCIFIRGNHDDLFYKWLTYNKPNNVWEKHGGASTKISYEKADSDKKQKHIRFLKQLKNYYINDNNELFVHGGYTHTRGINNEHFKEMCYWDRSLWEVALALNPNMKQTHPYFPERLKHYKTIFIGHTPTIRLGHKEPMNAANIWNIDTGAAFSGLLTIMDVDTKEFWQSDKLIDLYPNENGRN